MIYAKIWLPQEAMFLAALSTRLSATLVIHHHHLACKFRTHSATLRAPATKTIPVEDPAVLG
jgi:hypothetical protein